MSTPVLRLTGSSTEASIGRSRSISFSGIDGAGKSSQIQHLKAILEERGCKVRVIAFWDEIATLKRLRESAGHTIFKGDQGVGTPEAPVNRKDKNVRSAPMTAVRLLVYLLDAISNRRLVKHVLNSGADLVIFDRYLYDELANLELGSRLIRTYAKILLKMVPSPDIAFILDADPAMARARKPEYPIDFLLFSRNSYLRLGRLASGMTIVPPLSLEDAKRVVSERVIGLFARKNGEEEFSRTPHTKPSALVQKAF